jgi:lysophospholipase L1-like esterase
MGWGNKFPDLKNDPTYLEGRLSNDETQLAEKATLSYVDTKTAAIASGAPKGVYATLSALQTAFPTGNSNIYVVTTDGKWYYWNGSAWTAGGNYLSQTNVATNTDLHKLTDGWAYLYRNTDFTFTDGNALLSADGTVSTSPAYNAQYDGVTNFINISGFTHVSALIFQNDGLATAALAFYDANGTFISSHGSNVASSAYQLIPIPANATQIKYSYYIDSRAASRSMPNLSYIGLYNANSLSAKQTTNTNNITILQNRYFRSDALFDPSVATQGKGILATGIVTDSTKFVSDYIPITNADILYTYGGSASVWCDFYDANKTYIKYAILNFANPSTIISSVGGLDNVAYFQFADVLTNLNNIYLSKSPIVKKKALYQLLFNEIEHFNNGMINWWNGKKGDSLGDSITGSGYFQKYAREYFNLAKFSNHGIGGTKLTGAANSFGDSMWMDSRINALDADADFITIMGGTNDGYVTIGDATKSNFDTNTYNGALNTIIQKIYAKYNSNIKILLMTPTYISTDTSGRIEAQSQACRDIGQLWSIPLVDFNRNAMMNDYNVNLCFGTDKIHPLENAHRDYLTPVLVSVLEKMKPVDYTKAYYV